MNRILSLLAGLLAAPALFAATPAAHQGGLLGMLPMLIIFIVVFYFLLVRPQSKKAKEHRNLMSSISVGDEVVSAGGIVGKVAKLDDQFVQLTISQGVTIKMQKGSISTVLPKGTTDTGSDAAA